MKQKVLSFWKVKSFGINGFPIYREYIERFKILFFWNALLMEVTK